MEGGALFKIQSEAKERVLAAFAVIDTRKMKLAAMPTMMPTRSSQRLNAFWQNNCSKIPRTE